MKLPFKLLPIYPLAVLFAAVTILGCHNKPLVPGVWKNAQIDSVHGTDFHLLDTQLIRALRNGDTHQVENMMSAELLAAKNNSLLQQIGENLKTANYSLYEDYYAVNVGNGNQDIKSDIGITNYHLKYKAVAPEMYIALFLPKKGFNKWLITVLFAKYDYGWRIYQLDLNRYSIEGKNAIDLYHESQKRYAKGYLIDAINTMQLSRQCSRPSQIWQYNNETAMSDFYGKIMTEGNVLYHFPLTVKQVPTHPQIFRVFNGLKGTKYYPSVYYLSTIKIKDTTALKKENLELQKVIGKLMPGIDKDKKYIIYSVFNEKPTAAKQPDFFDMTQKIK